MMIVQGKDYPHTRLEAPGICYRAGEPAAISRAVLAGEAFDAAELALSAIMILADRGALPGLAIPVFPARAQLHGYLFVRRDSELHSFEDLPGRLIGMRDFSSTPACWFRGLLAERGVDWRTLRWLAGPKARFAPPPGADVAQSTEDAEALLLEGRIDAYFSAHAKDWQNSPEARRRRSLLPDPAAANAAWSARTGMLPIIHAVVVSAAAGPEAPRAIFDAYAAARRRAGGGAMPPYGLTQANRAAVARLAADLLEQGLIRAPLPVEVIFHAGAESWQDEG